MINAVRWNIVAFSIVCLLSIGSAYAGDSVNNEQNCSKEYLRQHPQRVLACYVAKYDSNYHYEKAETKQFPEAKVTRVQYNLTSQAWPQDPREHSDHPVWKHRLNIYKPAEIKSKTAILYLGSGTIFHNGEEQVYDGLSEEPFVKLAADNNAVVVFLKDVPNQYIKFTDGVPRKEDDLVAFTWAKFFQSPENNQFWPLHVPMTKAAVKAMDAVQEIMAHDHPQRVEIDGFVLAGMSKRGWTAWLTAVVDPRVVGVMPVVIDVLNIVKSIGNIEHFYDKQWPLALHDYQEQGILNVFKTIKMQKLMQIEDPFQYLACEGCEVYKQRLSIPKYILNASGDDFFVPDSSKLYFADLPGAKSLRYVPNQAHFMDPRIVMAALDSFYKKLQAGSKISQISWQFMDDGSIKIFTTKQPSKATLWIANNPQHRDFRFADYADRIRYKAQELTGTCKTGHCTYIAKRPQKQPGFSAYFAEFEFVNELAGQGPQKFIESTAVRVSS